MGDIRKSLYNGGAIAWKGTDVGWIKDVEFGQDLEHEILKTSGTGGPLKRRGKKAKEVNYSIKAGLFEVLNPTVLAMMLGGGSDPVESDGTPVTETMQPYTFAVPAGAVLQAITLKGVASGITIKNSAETVTYTANTDYLVDKDPYTGHTRIWRNPGGAIGSLATVKITYTYTPKIGYTLPLGANFALAREELVFSHIEDDSILDGVPCAVEFKITFWSAEPDSKPNFKFTDGGFCMPDITWDSLEDAVNHPTQPFGKIEILKVEE